VLVGSGVVFPELGPQTGGLDADDRVYGRVEVRWPIEYRQSDTVAAQFLRSSGQCMFHDMAQEAALSIRADEQSAFQ